MLTRINEAVALAKRETPKIGGSAAAFITLVAILVFIIVISCSAVVYLIREDVSHDAEAQNPNHPARGQYQFSGSPSDPTNHGSAKKYFTDILRKISGSQNPSNDSRKDKSRISRKSRGQGWVQAGNGSEWDSDSADERQATHQRQLNVPGNSTPMTMSDRDSVSLVALRSFNVDASPPLISRLSSPSSDADSTLGFDPQSVRGLSYADQLPSSAHQVVLPSIQSHLYSPQPSQSSSSSQSLSEPRLSQMAMTSPASLERSLAPTPNDNDGDSLAAAVPPPPLRTFQSGSRFIEGL